MYYTQRQIGAKFSNQTRNSDTKKISHWCHVYITNDRSCNRPTYRYRYTVKKKKTQTKTTNFTAVESGGRIFIYA